MFMCISSQEDFWVLESKKYSAYFVDLNKLIFPENVCSDNTTPPKIVPA